MSTKCTDVLSIDNFLPYRLVLVARKVSECLSEVYKEEFGITISEWRILAHLGEYKGLNAKSIGERAGMDKSMVSRAIKQMQDKGLLVKKKNEEDSRANNLVLSDEGLALYHKVVPKALRWEGQLLSVLQGGEADQLFASLSKLEKQVAALDKTSDIDTAS